jgi:hypothetical protein
VTLADFLLQRIAEDAAVARAASGAAWVRKYRQKPEPPFAIERYAIAAPVEFAGQELGTQVLAFTEDDTAESRALIDHAVRWDPARVLAECDAKRRIVTEFGSHCSDYGPPGSELRAEREAWAAEIGLTFQPHYPEEYAPFCDGCAAAESADKDHARVLLILAQPYAAHPSFDPAWSLD